MLLASGQLELRDVSIIDRRAGKLNPPETPYLKRKENPIPIPGMGSEETEVTHKERIAALKKDLLSEKQPGRGLDAVKELE